MGKKNNKNKKKNKSAPIKEKIIISARQATGSLISEARSRDIKIQAFSLALHGRPIVEDTELELNLGGRYGLIGRNGCGKSTFLQCLANREIPIPETFDIHLLDREATPSDLTAMEYVIQAAKDEIDRLDEQVEQVMTEDPESELLQELFDRQDELDPSTFESRAATILIGLGFDPAGSKNKRGSAIDKKCSDMSGGWRMRVALARALFIAPRVLLLDEPTNHLDLEACVWLENYLSEYKKILVIVSHSQDFLNGVCNNIIVLQEHKLRYWKGNYDMYLKTRTEQETNIIKAYQKQQIEIKEIKQFISSCGTYSNLIKQGKSRTETLG